MVFGAADAVRRDIRESRLSPAELIRGRKWEDALRVLELRHGLVEWHVMLIQSASNVSIETTNYKNGPRHHGMALERKPCERWPNDPTEDIKTLMKKDLIFQKYKHYWLTESGVELWNNLKFCEAIRETKNKIQGSRETKQAVIAYNTDVNLDRDGLLTTLSKMWWVARNRSVFRQLRLEESVRSYQENQAEIEKNLELIQTSEQRVARQLEEDGPPSIKSDWTVEQQRQQNDL